MEFFFSPLPFVLFFSSLSAAVGKITRIGRKTCTTTAQRRDRWPAGCPTLAASQIRYVQIPASRHRCSLPGRRPSLKKVPYFRKSGGRSEGKRVHPENRSILKTGAMDPWVVRA